MTFGMYSVRDINVGFNQPFCDATDESAKRGFAYACLNTDLMGFAPKDFDLYKIGEFDSKLGMLIPCEPPELVMRATEIKYEKVSDDVET